MRSTPADAGKTVMVFTEGTDIPDHPRRCGENGFPQCAWVSDSGSPPQVRGKHDACNAAARVKRITPAGAGVYKSFNLLFDSWKFDLF